MILLAIDVGNTNISCGIFRGNKIIKRFSVPTQDYSPQKIKRLLGKFRIDNTIVCSVVPPINKMLKQDLRRILKKSPYQLGQNLRVPVKNLYRKPSQVGEDRLVNAYAAIRLYGSPLVIVDFGTALTFDAVSPNEEYLGGLILPGLELCLKSLAKNTALLPLVKLSKPEGLIGRDTKNSILSGIVHGFQGVVDNLVDRLKKEMGKETIVIGTGGGINFLGNYYKKFDIIDKDLTLKGINMVFKKREAYYDR